MEELGRNCGCCLEEKKMFVFPADNDEDEKTTPSVAYDEQALSNKGGVARDNKRRPERRAFDAVLEGA